MNRRPLLLFAHGAGAGSGHPWMQAWAERLASVGRVVAFDYPYMQAGRRAPDRLPRLIAAHREALEATRADDPEEPVVLIGKSMGSRVGCHLAAELNDPAIGGVVCLGYPLRTPRGVLRDEVLLALEMPVLFVQGTRDSLCPLELLAEVRARMTARSELLVVAGGNHSLALSKRAMKERETTQEASDAAVLAAIEAFVGGLTAGTPADRA